MHDFFKTTGILLLTLWLYSPALGQDYTVGKRHLDKGNYQEALKEFQPLANQGHVGAQYELAEMYRYSLGVKEDNRQALAWYRKAAEQGHADAQYELGEMY